MESLPLNNRLILGTIIAYGVALAMQVSTMPTIAIELDTATEAHAATRTEVQRIAFAHAENTMSSVDSTEGYVRRYFSDIPIMAEVSRCESQFTHINPGTNTVLRGRVNSSDVGVMQINQYYHNDTAKNMGLDLLNIDDNLAYARNLYEREGTQPWSASSACWSGSQNLAMR